MSHGKKVLYYWSRNDSAAFFFKDKSNRIFDFRQTGSFSVNFDDVIGPTNLKIVYFYKLHCSVKHLIT